MSYYHLVIQREGRYIDACAALRLATTVNDSTGDTRYDI